jgi:hypothetical protein
MRFEKVESGKWKVKSEFQAREKLARAHWTREDRVELILASQGEHGVCPYEEHGGFVVMARGAS